MANILDYIKWRGDLGLEQSGFNEIDNLILSRFSYLPFDEIIDENEVVTIKELNKRFQKKDITKLTILWKDDIDLFPLMGNSKRFGEMKVTRYVNKISVEQEKQFSAITILMPDKTIFISYRGTDYTVVGWKEDLNMMFKSHLPSQIDALKYLAEIAKEYKGKIRLGGHSKGGNLAIYAAAFSKNSVKNRIINIYNNDGPGFIDEVIESDEYKSVIENITTFIPQHSIIGTLLDHKEDYTVVKSIQKGAMQHDLYSWQVLGNKFEYLKEITNGSKLIDKSIKKWFEETDAKKREQVIDIIFQVINTTNVETFTEIKANWLTHAKVISKSYKELDQESKEMVTQTLSALFKIAKDNFFEEHLKRNKKEN